jgi:putative lipoprotein (rSAM/lipoprotein system)
MYMKKRTHRSFIKGANRILAGILTILGFSGCHTERYGPDEYGSPYATFSFHGTVSNGDGQPVKDIKVEVGQDNYPMIDNPLLTNSLGEYFIQFQSFPDEDFQLFVSDIDGEANGQYRNDTISIKVLESDYHEQGTGNWNRGSADKLVDILLKEKE